MKSYPKLHELIQECWRVRRKERPNFDQIVARLQGDIGDEIKRKEEPKIELYSNEDDAIYYERVGKEDEIPDSDEEEEGGGSKKRGDVLTKAEHERIVAEVTDAKDKAMEELRAKMETLVRVTKEAEGRREREKEKGGSGAS